MQKKKNSPEAKAYMHHIRGMRKGKKTSDGNKDILGEGIGEETKDLVTHHHHHHHHHHHYTEGGNLLGNIGKAFSKAFDPKKNGVSNAFNKAKDAVVNLMSKFAKKTFTPNLGRKLQK